MNHDRRGQILNTNALVSVLFSPNLHFPHEDLMLPSISIALPGGLAPTPQQLTAPSNTIPIGIEDSESGPHHLAAKNLATHPTRAAAPASFIGVIRLFRWVEGTYPAVPSILTPSASAPSSQSVSTLARFRIGDESCLFSLLVQVTDKSQRRY